MSIPKVGGNVVVPALPALRRSEDVGAPRPWVPGETRARSNVASTDAVGKVASSEPFSSSALSLEQLRAAMPSLPPDRAQAMLPHLNAAMKEFNINTPARASAFLAQLAHESGELRYFEELASGAAYQGRADLGNLQPGDGVRFKGRGPIQLTGRNNYAAASRALGIDLVGRPEFASRADVGFRAAAWFWAKNGLNELADKGPGAFDQITRTVNGGFNGKADRDHFFRLSRAALGDGMGGGPLATSETPVPATDRPGNYPWRPGSSYATADAGTARMVRSYAERGSGFDLTLFYQVMMLANQRGWNAEKAKEDPEFLAFAESAGWQPGTPIPEALATEFLAHKLSERAPNHPGGLEGALDELLPPRGK